MGEETETIEKVMTMEDILSNTSVETNTGASNTKQLRSKKEKSLEEQIPKGKPKSGRIWKNQKQRFSSIVKTRGTRLSFEKKQKLRDDLKRVKEMSRAIKAQKEAEKEAKKQRRIVNLKRAEENRKKSEVVQVITNTAKLKKIKKKHLRTIEKRDTLKL
ncbi:PREDICTED: coiled-coil domain-containing protein 86 [Dufourea novaeangliae]|uniref:Coiled-coil domain-containing protein 86 n=1 Tax=Dufourea novaeangliae TaxID=178035 RepID=A0A154P9Y1_DUFNO|nr:PREDICTED: coiled-coil domain-containing protein 86 [Dufourea novaeangliae]KZC08028.1 Coiled-coil domain-containing protein 86 [Dufourea novaeangliae]